MNISLFSQELVFSGFNYDNLINKECIIINDTSVYNDLENQKIIKKLNFKDKVEVLELHDKLELDKSKSSRIVFIKVKYGDIVGWIPITSIFFPFITENNKYYGIKIKSKKDEIYNHAIYISFMIIDKNNKLIEKEIFKQHKKNNAIYCSYVENTSLSNINNDDKEEIVLSGDFVEGLWASDRRVEKAELWLNEDKNQIVEIFLNKKESESMYGESKYSYQILDNNNDGFKENIIVQLNAKSYESYLDPDWDVEKYGEYIIINAKYNYIWDGEKYIYKPQYYFVTVNNLRLRDRFFLDSNVTKLLKLNEKVELLHYIDKEERIDDIMGKWFYVKTENGELGWCFSGYLMEEQ